MSFRMSLMPRRAAAESGFTLIELLVVILIVGILVAVALPAFLSQKSKADDSVAKSQVGTMQTAIETYSTAHSGTYTGASIEALQEIEPSLKEETNAKPIKVEGSASSYTVESEATPSKDKFTLKSEAGVVTRTCAAGSESNKGGCPNKTW
jgi:type IV pilus assembly protein PilA